MTIPDGTAIDPGQLFTKTWRIKNAGTCTWTANYSMVFAGGDQMGSTISIPLGQEVIPEQIVEISASLLSPAFAGHYRGLWLLKNQAGKTFGSGDPSIDPLWVDISVNQTSLQGTANDLFENVCSATWLSGPGVLPCPGTDGNSQGFILKLDNPTLEDGSISSLPGLLTAPEIIQDGYILGVYPPFKVQSGDHFQATVSCESGATSCLALFSLDYQVANGPISNLWSIGEVYDGKTFPVDVALEDLRGQEVKFILQVKAFGPATGDRAMWIAPRIVRASQPTPVPTLKP